jgi:hypothetical protein
LAACAVRHPPRLEYVKAMADLEADAWRLFGCSLADAKSLPIAKRASAQSPNQDMVSLLFRCRLPFGTCVAMSRRTAAPIKASVIFRLSQFLKSWWATCGSWRIPGKGNQSPPHFSPRSTSQDGAAQVSAAHRKDTVSSPAKIGGVKPYSDVVMPNGEVSDGGGQ